MILDINTDVLPFLQLSADDAYGNVARIQSECEQFIKSYCGRNFEQTLVKEVVRRQPGESVFLKEYPVVSVQKLAIGSATALLVSNSNATTTAQVSVGSSGVSVSYNYGVGAQFLFASYATVAAITAAINTAGAGWSASVVAGFEQALSSELLPQMALECINGNSAGLAVPNRALSDYRINELTGEVEFPIADCGSPQNDYIHAYYTAGYSPIPADLKLGLLALIKSIYDRVNEGTLGVSMYRIEGLQKLMNDDVPNQTRDVLELYKKRRF